MGILGVVYGSEGHPKGTWLRICYTCDTEMMEQQEKASGGFATQEVVALPTETDYSRK